MTIESKETQDASTASWPLWQPPPGLPEPARQVWLAGLGALARAQAEGGKAFETLVHQGLTLQTQASQVAQERMTEAAAQAAQPWERLSGLSSIFEDRVARALAHLGLPTAQDWAVLQARVQALEAALPRALRVPTGSPESPQSAPRPSSAKTRAKPKPATAKTATQSIRPKTRTSVSP